MKTTSTFKMKKEYKMRLCNYKTKEMRSLMKRLFKDAQLTAENSEYVVFK
jgi:16S rRNA G1207 methylase RsmC